MSGVKTAPAWLVPSQPFTYSIQLNSTANVPGNQLADPIPAGVSYVPGSAWASTGVVAFSGDTITWSGDITDTIPVTITFDAIPSSLVCQDITNTAHLTSGQGLKLDLSATSIITGPVPAPEFSWLRDELVFTFTNETSGTLPLGYMWDFGDGITSTETSPVHGYLAPGTYNVSLSASNLCGTALISHPLQAVCTPPAAAFSWQTDNLLVTFTDQSSGTRPFTYSWDFGDGQSSTDASPSHSYAATGLYTVRLVVKAPCGTAEYSSLVWVGNFTFLPLAQR